MDRKTKKDMGIQKIENTVVDDLLDWCDSFAFSLFVIILIFMFVVRIVVVDGRSMMPTLRNGDRVLIMHMFSEPEQGDVVVMNSDALGKTIIKRVIATEGQSVEINYSTDEVMVDGKKIDESYLSGASLDMQELNIFSRQNYDAQTKTYKYTVPEDCVFVLGDNRNNSTDSRAIGCVSVDSILGRVFLRVFPFSKFGTLE